MPANCFGDNCASAEPEPGLWSHNNDDLPLQRHHGRASLCGAVATPDGTALRGTRLLIIQEKRPGMIVLGRGLRLSE